jgi:2-dehydropantoate 2-reductase
MVRILVYGAGVIGTLYSARLHDGGHNVTILARGERLADIRRYGLSLVNFTNGDRSVARVNTTERLGPDDQYDVVIVMVRRDQLASVMPELMANRNVPTMLFMLNNPVGWDKAVRALGQDRVLLGFPGAGGTRDGHVISYVLIAQQPTTLGEVDGRQTARLQILAEAFRKAGFPTKISRDMDAWLKGHAFFVTAISGAIYRAGGDCRRLSEESASLALMTQGVREGFSALRVLGLPVTPFPLRVLFTWLPKTFAISYWRRFFASNTADYVFGRHARFASAEMLELADDCRSLLEKSRVEAPALAILYREIEAFAPGRR